MRYPHKKGILGLRFGFTDNNHFYRIGFRSCYTPLYTPTPNRLSQAAKLAPLGNQSVERTYLPEESVQLAVFVLGAQRSFQCCYCKGASSFALGHNLAGYHYATDLKQLAVSRAEVLSMDKVQFPRCSNEIIEPQL